LAAAAAATLRAQEEGAPRELLRWPTLTVPQAPEPVSPPPRPASPCRRRCSCARPAQTARPPAPLRAPAASTSPDPPLQPARAPCHPAAQGGARPCRLASSSRSAAARARPTAWPPPSR
jgi:hypothetical protein